MRKILYLIALVAVFCFLPVQEARASISSNIGIWYFEATNEEWGVAEISPDYSDQAYYQLMLRRESP